MKRKKDFFGFYVSQVFSGGLGVAFGGVFVAGGGAFDDIQSVRRVSAAEYFRAANGVCGAWHGFSDIIPTFRLSALIKIEHAALLLNHGRSCVRVGVREYDSRDIGVDTIHGVSVSAGGIFQDRAHHFLGKFYFAEAERTW